MVDSDYYTLSWFQGEGRDQEMQCEPQALQGLRRNLPGRQRVCESWPPDVTFRAWGTRTQDVPYYDSMHHDVENPPWRREPGEFRTLSCRVKDWLLFSERLKAAFERAGLSGCQFHPVAVAAPWEAAPLRYWYAHTVWLEGAIDLDRSRYEEVFAPGIARPAFFEYVLRRTALGGADVFRLADSTGCVFCSQRFRDFFMQQGFTGLGFTPVRVSD